MSDTEVETKPKAKRQQTEGQMEGLRKAMATIKAKREALAKEKEQIQTKIEKGELPKDTPIPKEKRNRKGFVKPPPPPALVPEPVVKPIKARKPSVSKVSQQFASFKEEMLAIVSKPAEVKTVEKIVEKPIERVIQKERVITGSEMLNKIFNL